jgi:hypothetical protein
MITKMLVKKDFLNQKIPAGASNTDFTADFPLMVTDPAWNLQRGVDADYASVQFLVTGTMPAGSIVYSRFYAKDRLLGTTTTGALGAYTNTNVTINQTHALIKSADRVVITLQCQQNTAYTVDAFLMLKGITKYDEQLASLFSDVDFQIGASVAATNPIVTTLTFNDSDGAAIAERGNAFIYASSDANGETPASLDTAFSATAGTLVQQHTALRSFTAQTTAAGLLTVTMTHNVPATFYLNVFANGKKWTSGAIVWT